MEEIYCKLPCVNECEAYGFLNAAAHKELLSQVTSPVVTKGPISSIRMRRQQCLGKNRWHLEKLGAGLEEVFSCRLRETRERGTLQKGVLQE